MGYLGKMGRLVSKGSCFIFLPALFFLIFLPAMRLKGMFTQLLKRKR
nr:hypothetical protein Q903MT_gene2765 [Picea sitchensis]